MKEDVFMKILVVDDEAPIRELLVFNLAKQGYETDTAADGGEALAKARDADLILLDVMLPVMDGFEVCRRLKGNQETAAIPIIMLTARNGEIDKVLGLELGADDYVAKPFSTRELIARVKAVLRRAQPPKATDAMQLSAGPLVMDLNAYTASVDGQVLALTPKEYDILRFLMRNAGTVFSPNEIYRRVWEDVPLNAAGAIAVHIRHLREKLEINPSEPRYIKVVWGKGYKMEGGVS